jgi:uncharacterized protein (TIGR03086 family)
MSTETLERAFACTRNVLSNVKADQLDDPTPCASWTVRRLINHIVGGSHWFAISTSQGASPAEDTTEDTDYAAGDFVGSFDEGVKASIAAFGGEGALDKTLTLPWGPMPASAFMALATTDTFTHGWDLARATGQDVDLDPVLAEQLLAGAQAMIPDQFRGDDGVAPFGPQVAVDGSAPAATRLAAFLGRTP